MATFANKKTLLFKEAGDIEIARKRSEGRLKTYISANDLRAWCANNEDRRQYILELIEQETATPKCGKIIPLQGLIDIMLAEKNKIIADLTNEINELRGGAPPTKRTDHSPSHQKAGTDRSQPQSISARAGQPAGVAQPARVAQPAGAPQPTGVAQPAGVARPATAPQSSAPPAELAQSAARPAGTPQPSAPLAQPARSGAQPAGDPALTEKAIKELENIQKIINTPTKKDEPDEMQAKLAKLEQIIFERDELKQKVDELEQELAHYKGSPNNFQRDGSNLQQRFNNLKDLPEQIRIMKRQADQCGDLKKTVQGKDGELDDLKCRCNDSENSVAKLKKTIKQLEEERNKYRNESQEKCCELCKLQKDYDKRLKELEQCRQELKQCKLIEEEYEELRSQVSCAKEMEEERDLLMKKIMEYEACIEKQANEIERLLLQIEGLSSDLDKRQDEVKTEIVRMRVDLHNKDELIRKSEERLADVQDELRESINGLTCETTCLRNRLEELDKERIKYHTKSKQRKELLNKIKSELNEKNKLLKQYKQKNSELEDLLNRRAEELTVYKRKSEEFDDLSTKKIGDEHFQRILGQTNCALECVIKKMRCYELGDGSNLLARIDELERELKMSKQKAAGGGDSDLSEALKKIQMLEENLRLCKEENAILKNANGEVQNLAKDELQQVKRVSDEMVLEKDSQIQELRKQLELSQSGDNAAIFEEMNKLRQLNDELKKQLTECQERLKSTEQELDKMKILTEELQERLDDCRELMKSDKAVAEFDSMRSLVNDLRKQLDDCVERSKLSTDDLSKMIISDLEKQLEECKESKHLEGGDDLSQLVNDLQRQLAQYEELAKSTEEEIRNLQDLVADLNRQLDDCQNQSRTGSINDDINNMRKLMADLEQQLNDCQETNRLTSEENQKLTGLIGDLENQLENQKDENLLSQIEDLNRRLTLSEEALSKAEAGELAEENIQLQLRLDELLAELEKSKEMLEKQKKDCENEIQKLQDEYEKNGKSKKSGKGEKAEKVEKENVAPKKQKGEEGAKAKKSSKKGGGSLDEGSEVASKKSKRSEDEPPQAEPVVAEKSECKCDQLPTIIPISLLPSDVNVQFQRTCNDDEPPQCKKTCLANFNYGTESETCGPCNNRNLIQARPAYDKSKIQSITLDMMPLKRQYPRKPLCTLRISSYDDISQAQGNDFDIIQKIAETENRFKMKQQRAKAKVNKLQNMLVTYKSELQTEKDRNDKLLNSYSTQSKTIANMLIQMHLVKREIIEEKKRNLQLDHELKQLEKGLGNRQHQCRAARNLAYSTRCSLTGSQESRQANQYLLPSFYTEIQMKPQSARSSRSCGCSSGRSKSTIIDRYEIDD